MVHFVLTDLHNEGQIVKAAHLSYAMFPWAVLIWNLLFVWSCFYHIPEWAVAMSALGVVAVSWAVFQFGVLFMLRLLFARGFFADLARERLTNVITRLWGLSWSQAAEFFGLHRKYWVVYVCVLSAAVAVRFVALYYLPM